MPITRVCRSSCPNLFCVAHPATSRLHIRLLESNESLEHRKPIREGAGPTCQRNYFVFRAWVHLVYELQLTKGMPRCPVTSCMFRQAFRVVKADTVQSSWAHCS